MIKEYFYDTLHVSAHLPSFYTCYVRPGDSPIVTETCRICKQCIFINNYSHSWFQTCAVSRMLYYFLLVIPRRLNFVPMFRNTMELDQTECSETSAYKIRKQGNHTKQTMQQLQPCLMVFLVKSKRRLHYLKTQSVPRCKQFSFRL